MKTQDIDEDIYSEVFERIHSVTQMRTQVELADFLGVKQSSISDAKRRRSIPAEWLLKLYWEKRVNPEWVMMGRGGKFLKPVNNEIELSFVHVIERRPPEECSAQELVSELVRRALSEC